MTERVDHGARGPANQARPQRMIETMQAGVTCREFRDTHLVDRLLAAGQVSAVQHAAALRVLDMHDQSGFEPRVAASYAPSGWRRGHDDEQDEAVAVTRFRDLLGQSTEEQAWVLHAMALGDAPGPRGLGVLRSALDRLADRWGIA